MVAGNQTGNEVPFPLIKLLIQCKMIKTEGGVDMTGIYAIRNTFNNKYYIGQTKDIYQRWMQHRSRLKCGTHENCHLQSSYNKYGEDSFEYSVLEECSEDLLDDRERYYINQYDSYDNGYNLDQGGAGCPGYKHTEEFKQNLSEKRFAHTMGVAETAKSLAKATA